MVLSDCCCCRLPLVSDDGHFSGARIGRAPGHGLLEDVLCMADAALRTNRELGSGAGNVPFPRKSGALSGMVATTAKRYAYVCIGAVSGVRGQVLHAHIHPARHSVPRPVGWPRTEAPPRDLSPRTSTPGSVPTSPEGRERPSRFLIEREPTGRAYTGPVCVAPLCSGTARHRLHCCHRHLVYESRSRLRDAAGNRERTPREESAACCR